jgi:hypothetical protein
MNGHSLRSRLSVAIGAALLTAACANSGAAVSEREDMLASAGFVQKRADSPTRMASLKALPPHQFLARTRNGATRYLYADPTVCGCIYVGDQNAYDRYREQVARGKLLPTNKSAPSSAVLRCPARRGSCSGVLKIAKTSSFRDAGKAREPRNPRTRAGGSNGLACVHEFRARPCRAVPE